MLIMGETYNQSKAMLWDLIHSCQALIKVIKPNSPLAREVIAGNREIIRSTYADLKELTRWFKQSGLEPDEPYVPPSVKARWEAMTEEEKEAEDERRLDIAMQILAIVEKERNGWK